MNIALVILNWNGKKLLETFLPTMVANSPDAEIVLVDNASEDNSITYVEENFPEVTILKHAENFGFAKGYNVALSKIKADVFCLINSDIEVTPNWLQPISKFYNENKNSGIVQPKILDYKNKDFFEYAGAAGGYIDKYGYAYCRGRIFETLEKDQNQYESTSISWASGACFFIKSTDYELLGGLDEDFFAHYEEIDLCWRAINNGVHIHYIAESTVYHVGGATLNKVNPFKTFLNFRNSLFTLLKNLPRRKIIPIIFTRMVLDGLAGVLFLLQGKPKHVLSILKAHVSFYLHFSLMRFKRGNYQTRNYYQTKSIVWNYYIKKQRIFKA
ncbi:glycosyltransferase family 2 protein [Wenyingzhuangia sp. 2_MG-2023]|uniref:glycosyltransferase family 2 protein n=1 Tax=Wenyingzhuangia sp. 2_MG-2023 TaxID=3062639 RepID=UPI0026E3D20B|nr:glycosyltransferase family 2 protein [Wenyingzhuangia sp. 2_MG-2023]MDO6738555.1 glycosyltransferase family 2 protein [Wenyingzhuangia sp. 2_MG-2023]